MSFGFGFGFPKNYVAALFNTPASLFTTGVNGAWYDPSDITTLYQDAAGTTPVTAVEQPVGLMLDQRNTEYSVYFDGTGDYLSIPYSSNLDIGTGDFTVEAFVYLQNYSQYFSNICGTLTYGSVDGGTNDSGWHFIVTNDGAVRLVCGLNSSPPIVLASTAANAVQLNTWTHICATRYGNTFTIFVNGVALTTATNSVNFTKVKSYFYVASLNRSDALAFAPGVSLTGRISNCRIVKGTALYTANFTPPTAPLTAVSGTSLLTCGTSWSGNPAITRFGDVRADNLNPFGTGTGNHAFNSSGNSANFPVLSARYNLLTKTEQFDNSVWGKQNVSVTADSTVAPNGTATADSMFETAANNVHNLNTAVDAFDMVSTNYSFLCYAKSNGRGKLALRIGKNSGIYDEVAVLFDLTNERVYSTSVVGTGVYVSSSIASVGNGWFRCVITGRSGQPGGLGPGGNILNVFALNDSWAVSYAGDTGKGIYIWGADLRVANDALNQPAYQRVNTATDYDTVGFKPYLSFNGVNQWLQTNSIDFTNTAQMFVSAGVRKLSDGTFPVIVETYKLSASTFDSFILHGSQSSTLTGYAAGIATTATSYWSGATGNRAAPITDVVSGTCNSKATTFANAIQLRINTSSQTLTDISTAGNATTNNFGSNPLFIGAREGSSLWFNGRLYQMVVAGKQASANEITNTETYINQKTGAY